MEREALKLAVQRPALCGPEFDALGADAFTAPVHGAVFSLIAALRRHVSRRRQPAGVGRPAARGGAERAGAGVRDRAGRRAVGASTGEPDAKYAEVLLAQVGELAVSREINSVKARLQRMNPVEEQAGYNRMFGDLVGLEKRRKALLDRAAGA